MAGLFGAILALVVFVAAPQSGAATRMARTKPAAKTTPTTTALRSSGPAADTCGGGTIRKASGGTWQCTFDDEFNGTTLDRTKWVLQKTA